MFDAERARTIFTLFIIGGAILGALLPTVALTMVGAVAYALGFLMLVSAFETEMRAVTWIALGNAIAAALLGHIILRGVVRKETNHEAERRGERRK
jgi:membrane protein implicated in regulation of membrane protease activity